MKNFTITSLAIVSLIFAFAATPAQAFNFNFGHSAFGNIRNIVQTGNWNVAHVEQPTPSGNNSATVNQPGAVNAASVTQVGHDNEASVTQHQSFNFGSIFQKGDDNKASIIQSGDGNFASVFQSGKGNTFTIVQTTMP
jgi:hypothetical protein